MSEIVGRYYYMAGYHRLKFKEEERQAKGNETQKQQGAIKEENVRESFIRLAKEPIKMERFKNSSLNKIAKDIYDYVFPILKNKKTKTGAYVLTRTKKLDKEGYPIITGLSIDTIIRIMKKQKDLAINPFIKKTA